MKKIVLFAAIGLVLIFLFKGNGSVSLGPGAFAPEEPLQLEIEDPITFEKNGFQITPLAEYSIKAKILSTRRYRGSSNEAKLSPVDFALGWGAMSDESIVSQIDISQNGRFFYWRTPSNPPIPAKEIKRSSANTHLIPASRGVRETLLSAKVGSIISISGKLVKAEAPGGWKWTSSLTRSDSGNGACEIIYVESAYTSMGNG